MELYLIKSAACLVILLLFYKIFLEKESFHVFKRYYLLGALLVSFGIPLITFIQYVEPEYVLGSFNNPIDDAILNTGGAGPNGIINQPFNWLPLLWSVYGAGVLFFSIRFLVNLSKIVKRIKSNPKTKRQSFINVLLNDLVIPHTFFNYIFLNKYKFENQEIPEEVLLHEQTHAKQKHSLDILFIEILTVIFWFNPLLYLLKGIMKLNHEFLADRAVMNHGANPTTYQQLLLAFSSNASEPQLANAINYSSIKKRFTVMKTRTTQKTTWIKSLVLLPLLAFMVYGFSSTKTVEKSIEPILINDSATKHTARSIDLKILDDGNYSVDGITATKNTLVATFNSLHQDITPEIRNNIMNIHVSSSKQISNKETWFIYNSLLDYGFYRMVTSNQEIVRGKGNTPFKINEQNQTEAYTISENITIYIVNNQKLIVNNKITNLKGLSEALNNINNLLSTKERQNQVVANLLIQENTEASIISDVKKALRKYGVSKLNIKTQDNDIIESVKKELEKVDALKINYTKKQESASREQMAEYNKLAKHYNSELKKDIGINIKMKHVKRLKYIYNIMSDKQRKDAEPFPDFPEPPPAPPAVKLDVDFKVENIPPPPPIPPNATPAQKAKYKKVIDDYNNNIPPPPPPPKAPPTMEELAEKGAVFYLEGKRISFDKAISIVNKNKSINIQIKDVDSKQPTVKLSKKGITVKRNN